MLNELLIAHRGSKQAGVEMTLRHPDVKDVRRVPTLLVELNETGRVASIRPVDADIPLWSLRNGNHNSFPFVQPKHPLWLVGVDDKRRQKALDRKNKLRREAILELDSDANFNVEASKDWPGDGLLDRLRKRHSQLTSLIDTDGAVVLATFERFVLACDRAEGGDPQRLLRSIIEKLIEELRQSPGNEWSDVATAILLEGSGGIMFSAAGRWPSIIQANVVLQLSNALRACRSDDTQAGSRCCALSGIFSPLVKSKFPQPNLPVLGQTYLFARNRNAPANERYGRFSADSMPVAQHIVIELAAAIKALTSPERDNVTWRSIPSNAPKQSDLLLAYVEAVPDAPVAAALAEDDEEQDLSAETPGESQRDSDNSIVAFEKRTQRLVQTVQAKLGADIRSSPVRLIIIRKVDRANRKVVYSGQPTVGNLQDAAIEWVTGEINLPPWLSLRVLRKGERKPSSMFPPHIAPLGLVSFSRQLYIRSGKQRQEISGLPAAEALSLFLDLRMSGNTRRRAMRILRLVLNRRMLLVVGTAQAIHFPFDFAKEADQRRRETLRTATLLGVLLQKLGREGEQYMSNAAFKLGQLLAAADVLHAGYCADVRGGSLPPSLLGNQVFMMAQTSPAKALAALCRRWKPYDGWAQKALREQERIEKLKSSNKPDESRRGWDIKKALRHAREIRPLADELSQMLSSCSINDIFRAELLLGYIAGLPKEQKRDPDKNTEQEQSITEEG